MYKTLFELDEESALNVGEYVTCVNSSYKAGILIAIDPKWKKWGGAASEWWTRGKVTDSRNFDDVFGTIFDEPDEVEDRVEDSVEKANPGFVERLYIIMRRDLYDMNPGKAIAQGGHAVSEFESDIKNLGSSGYYFPFESEMESGYQNWRDQSSSGLFGTKIVLWATREQMDNIIHNIIPSQKPTISGEVVDDTYPYRNWQGEVYTREETTCWYVFGWCQEICDSLKDLEMHP